MDCVGGDSLRLLARSRCAFLARGGCAQERAAAGRAVCDHTHTKTPPPRGAGAKVDQVEGVELDEAKSWLSRRRDDRRAERSEEERDEVERGAEERDGAERDEERGGGSGGESAGASSHLPSLPALAAGGSSPQLSGARGELLHGAHMDCRSTAMALITSDCGLDQRDRWRRGIVVSAQPSPGRLQVKTRDTQPYSPPFLCGAAAVLPNKAL